MAIINKFPGIKRAALYLAHANGMIYRGCTEEQWLSSLDYVLGAEGVDTDELQKLDDWCKTLSDEQVETLVDGEEEEMQQLVDSCPTEAVGIFNDIFDSDDY